MILDEQVAMLGFSLTAVHLLLKRFRCLDELVLGSKVLRLGQITALLVVLVLRQLSWLHIRCHFVEVVLRQAAQIKHALLLGRPVLEQLV